MCYTLVCYSSFLLFFFALGRLCFVIVAIPRYLHLHFWVNCLQSCHSIHNAKKKKKKKKKKILQEVVHLMIIDQCNQTMRNTKSKQRLFIAALFLSLWCQSASDRELPLKSRLGHLGNCADTCLIRVCICTAFANNREVRIN